MAVLDKVLASMKQRGADGVTIVAGEVPRFETATGPKAIVKNPLSEEKAVEYLTQVASGEVVAALREKKDATWRHRSFEIDVSFASGKLVARFRESEAASDSADPPADATGPGDSPSPPPPPQPVAIAEPVSDGPLIDALFRSMIARGASDLHLRIGEPPLLRIDGEMVKMKEVGPIDAEMMVNYLDSICPKRNQEEFAADGDSDFAYSIEGLARFRCNYLLDRYGRGAVFRQIPNDILTAEDLNLSDRILELCWLSKGFVVVTGPTGSGKSTTLAALVDYINRKRSDHIITVEDPIEFVHPNKGCLLTQREVGVHTNGFKRALRAALREDPDIVLVGEMRDLETIAVAIETAETGHLVFGTLHTTTAPSTIDRIIDQFPADRQNQIRTMLSESLKAVIAQVLCRKKGGGRIAALEVLFVNNAIANLIREGKTFQIPSIMQTQKGLGNITLNDSLLQLVKRKIVEPQEAYVKAVDKEGLLSLYKRNNVSFDPGKMESD